MNSALPGISLTKLPSAHPVPAKARKAAQDFEAVLLGSVLDALAKSFAGPVEDASIGAGDYGFMGSQALASAIAQRGGIGLADMIVKSWATHEGTLKP